MDAALKALSQTERDRLDDAVADAVAAVVNRVAMLDGADDYSSRFGHECQLVARCRELKAAYDARADALGYDRSKAR